MRKLIIKNEKERNNLSIKPNTKRNKSVVSPREVKNISKIPFNEYQANIEKKRLDKIKFFSSDSNHASMYSINVCSPDEKSKILNMRDRLDVLFKTKLPIDNKKLQTIYRKGLSDHNISSLVKEGSKVTYPQLQKKTPLTNFMTIRRVQDNTFESHYKKVIEVRRENAKGNVENLMREVIVKYKSNF